MANKKVDECDQSGPFSPGGSQGGSSPGTGGERKEDKSRRRQSSPVISVNGSGGLPTRRQRSRTIPASTSTSSRNSQLLTTQQPHQLPIAPREMADGYQHAPEYPPITPDSLAELDMPRIINNPKLRHDVNFDRELLFGPDLDGYRDKLKIESAELYWKALEGELIMCGAVQARKHDANYVEMEDYWQHMLSACLRRLPKAVKAIKDILKTLVPDYDQESIIDRLDVALIMCEISHGVCDLVDLANWLGKVLMNHCAPMRDELVDRMMREIKGGATEQKPAKLVNGLRQLFTILEVMKLDVANHQIRHMRPILIDNSVEFWKHYNLHRVGQGKIDVMKAKYWIENARANIWRSSEEDILRTYIHGMCTAMIENLLFPDYAGLYPETFYLDVERLKSLRIEFHTIICHLICRDVLIEFCGARASPQERGKAIAALHATVSAIVDPMGQFEENRKNIAAEIMRSGLVLEGRPHITYDAALVDALQERLEIELQYGSAVYERHADTFRSRVTPKLIASVEHDVKLPALQLQDKLVPQISVPVVSHAMGYGAVCTPNMSSQPLDLDDDYIRRLTHVLSLHWQIWADICYLVPYKELEKAFLPGDGRTPPASPTVPVAQAVYAAGQDWLPVGLTVTEVEVTSGLPSPAPSQRPQSRGHEKIKS